MELDNQLVGVSVSAPKSCTQGEKTARNLNHLLGDKATLAGEIAAFG